jgi:hypothetical protein
MSSNGIRSRPKGRTNFQMSATDVVNARGSRKEKPLGGPRFPVQASLFPDGSEEK